MTGVQTCALPISKIEEHIQWLHSRDLLRRAINGYQGIINFMQEDRSYLLGEFFRVNDKLDQYRNEKFEEIFLGVGAEVLQFVSSAATVNPNQAIRSMKDELKSAAESIKKSKDSGKIEKFKTQLQKLNKLGGAEKIVPIEGIVFSYNDKVYKLTGTFAPLNQLLGLMKYA